MKKTMTIVCALACAVFLYACAADQAEKAGANGAENEGIKISANTSQEDAASTDEQADNAQQKIVLDDGQAEDSQNGETTTNKQETLPAVQMRGLMQGVLGGIGSGFLAYTLPGQGEDYQLYFFAEGDIPTDLPMSEARDYPLEMADYIFPDVRENNVPIGDFMEIYFSDTITVGGDGAVGLAVVAAYDVNGKTCYDTRIYRWDGTNYRAEEKQMQELNEQYSNAQDYPVEELYHLSSDTAGQSISNPIGENQG